MTKIEWTDRTWNPFTGCDKVSPACDHCYADTMAKRLQKIPQTAHKYRNGFKPTFHPEELTKPSQWKKPQRIFVVSMGDIFHPDNSFQDIAKVFDVMLSVYHHTYFILTKRPERIQPFLNEYYNSDLVKFGLNMLNIWFGVTAENQEMANLRLPILLEVNCLNKFVSIEPMLGPINISKYLPVVVGNNQFQHFSRYINWVIVGGETGNKARPMHPQWVESIKSQCEKAIVPFFFKAWGAWSTSWMDFSFNIPKFKYYDSFMKWKHKAWVIKGNLCLDMKGQICKNGLHMEFAKYPVVILSKTRMLKDAATGKKFKDNLIHGKTYLQKHNHYFANGEYIYNLVKQINRESDNKNTTLV